MQPFAEIALPQDGVPERFGAAQSLDGSLLLATDGSPPAAAAARVFAELAGRWRVEPRVLTVVPPTVSLDPVYPTLSLPPDAAAAARIRVAEQLAICAPDAARWTHDVVIGSPAEEIIRAATVGRAQLVVLGLRSHTILDRVFRDETALTVMRHVSAPVLAVTPTLRAAPRRMAVAVDFSRASLAAARAAMALLSEGGELFLVYVEPSPERRTEVEEGFRVIYAQGLAGAFVRLRSTLRIRSDITIDTVLLQGSVATELLAFARGSNIDAIAIGSQRHSITRRAFVGSVTTTLARTAECSLLVMPPGRRA